MAGLIDGRLLAGFFWQCAFLERLVLTLSLRIDSLSSMNDKNRTGCAGTAAGCAVESLPKGTDESLAAFAKALAHPVRIQILRILARRTACVCGDIVNELPLAQSTVSEHLRILKAAGLILGEVSGPRVCYCIDSSALSLFKSLVEGLPSPKQTSIPAECQEAR